MSAKRAILLFFWLMGLSVPLFGCASGPDLNIAIADPFFTTTAVNSATETQTPFRALTNTPATIPPTYTPTFTDTPLPTSTATPSDTPIPTYTPTRTNTPIPTNTSIPTPTSDLVWHNPGDVIAPILLYHHVANTNIQNRYFVSVAKFRAQMEALREWGYTSITVSDLVNVLINGGELPSRPVVITFDDGNLDVYQNAFPILHEMGFVATTYIIANNLQAPSFVDVTQLRELANDGWEIGCHSMSHVDLTIDHSKAYDEILKPRLVLQKATGEPINTFAYPYGKIDEFVANKVSQYGYTAGIGLGMNQEHTLNTLFYLNRREVEGGYDLSQFASLLPWSDQ
jgi:peptidoglycan/xylan/chitin deacetylase (PgdA/CDA1 family)